MPSIQKTWKHTDPKSAPRKELLGLAREALEEGDSLLAYDITQKALDVNPGDVELRQIAASALINAGCPMRAVNDLETMVDEGHTDEETLGLLASVCKDIRENSTDPEQRDIYGRKALAQYKRGFEKSGGTYTGINAAAMHLFLGEKVKADSVGRDVLSILQAQSGNDYWHAATLAETHLILGDLAEAVRLYREAIAHKDARPAWLATTRKQALQLAEAQGCLPELESVFPVPGIVLSTGHMIDQPGRTDERFPPDIEPLVRDAIDQALEELNAQYGFVSAACGSDLIFIEAMLERGAEVHIFLPFVKEDFLETSLRYAGPQWVKRFDTAMDQVAHVHYCTSEHYLGYDELFNLCNDIAAGFTVMRGQSLNVTPSLLAIWDGKAGVAGRLADHWKREIGNLHQIDTSKILATLRANTSSPASSLPTNVSTIGPGTLPNAVREIKALIFADVTGFSKLRDEDNPLFVDSFLLGVAQLIEKSGRQPAFHNTWGDGLFFVYDQIGEAVQFALDLRDWMNRQDWTAHGLPSHLNIRISMHVGPVYAKEDPVLGRTNYFGSHVARAARIEPITLPGQVYASENVAALLSVGHKGFDFEYVGEMDLPKKYGRFPIYLLLREGVVD